MNDLTKTNIINGAWSVWAICFGLPIAWVLAAALAVVLSPVWIAGCIKRRIDWGWRC